MKFGVVITPVWGRETDPQVQFAEHREIVELAEQLGIDMMVAGQHFLGSELRYYQPVPYLTYMSQFAPRMDVAIGIILLSLVNPLELAEQVATMDAITGGRVILGLGLGYSDHEFRAFGIPRETRIKRFEEGIELIKALWTGEPVTHKSDLFDLDNVSTSVLPVRKPRPPIWAAGQAEKPVRRAARFADAWYPPPFPTHEGLAHLRNIYLEERDRCGLPLDGDFPVRREMVIASSRDEARKMAAERSAARYDLYVKWGLGTRLNEETKGLGSQADEDIDGRFILGSPEECAEQLDALRRNLGMTHFVIKPQWFGMPHAEAMRQVELFGTKVLPLLNAEEN